MLQAQLMLGSLQYVDDAIPAVANAKAFTVAVGYCTILG